MRTRNQQDVLHLRANLYDTSAERQPFLTSTACLCTKREAPSVPVICPSYKAGFSFTYIVHSLTLATTAIVEAWQTTNEAVRDITTTIAQIQPSATRLSLGDYGGEAHALGKRVGHRQKNKRNETLGSPRVCKSQRIYRRSHLRCHVGKQKRLGKVGLGRFVVRGRRQVSPIVAAVSEVRQSAPKKRLKPLV